MTTEDAGSRTPANKPDAGAVPRDAAEAATAEHPTTEQPTVEQPIVEEPTAEQPAAEQPATEPTGQRPAGGPTWPGTPPRADPPPPGGQAGGYVGAGFPLRRNLVRPIQGRYVAGVCAAIGRATNTDPVLSRVVLAVLALFGLIGVLVYLIVWLITPAEGDTASPVEGLLGRGRSSTSPIVVVLLGIAVAVVFGVVVTDGFRVVLLGTALLIAMVLLLNRGANGRLGKAGAGGWPAGMPGPAMAGAPGGGPAYGPPSFPAYPPPAAAYPPPGQGYPTGAGPYPPAPGGSGAGAAPPPASDTPSPDTEPTGPGGSGGSTGSPDAGPAVPAAPYPPAAGLPRPPGGPGTQGGHLGAQSPAPAYLTVPAGPATPAGTPAPPPVVPPLGLPAPPMPPSGYRPPFAPRGPYAGGSPPWNPPPVGPHGTPPPPPPPKPPKERSRLGAATFSMVLVVLGAIAALDLSGAVSVEPSAYFAGALTTVGLGLLIGAWFGRARWLIFIGIVLSLALGISAVAESVDRVDNVGMDVRWAPTAAQGMADRYQNNFGDAVLDLSAVDFTGQDKRVTVEVNFGRAEIILPPTVDVTAGVEVGAGEVRAFDERWSGFRRPITDVTDLGTDGPGGGKLHLTIRVNAGDLEVHR